MFRATGPATLVDVANTVSRFTRTWRTLLVWLHVLTSVAWMSTALGLAVLLLLSRDDPTRATAAVEIAHQLDMHLLAPAATASAFTGLMLGLATPWGLLHHWWVAAKFAITLVQLYVGIGILSAQLGSLAAGGAPSPPALIAASAAMGAAIAFQAWLSLAKPWPRTPLARRGAGSAPLRLRTDGAGSAPLRLPTAGAGWFVAGVLAPVGDLTLSQLLGFPSPLLMLPTLLGALVWLRLVRRVSPAPAGRTPGSPPPRTAGTPARELPGTPTPAGAGSAGSGHPAAPPRRR